METTLRILVGLGLTLLLVMLRLESERFGTAEYDEPVRGRKPSIMRRLAWYILGVAGVVALLFIHPSAQHDLFLQVGDRSGIIIALIVGGLGIAWAVGQAYLHYHRLRFPAVAAYPGAVANEVLTAFIDEAVFRGAVLGYSVWVLAATEASPGMQASLAILGQSVVYVLATRLGAPGRDRYMLILALLVGLVCGWATMLTGGIGAAFLGHAITRVAVFLTTGHAGQPPAPGTEVEDIERRRSLPDGWSAVDQGSAQER
jgi:hypothetical protein